MVPLKRARVGTLKKSQSDLVEASLDVSWQSSDVQQAWTSCLKLLRHTEQCRLALDTSVLR